MARKTKEEAGQTREAILDAAELVFHERGVSRSSLEEIARRAGCTRGAVYWHFANKRDLLLAMTRRIDALIAERRLRMRAEADVDPMRALRDYMRFVVTELLDNPHVSKVLDITRHRCEYVDEMRGFLEILDDEQSCHFREIIEMFERAQARGQIRADLPPQMCVIMARALLDGIIRDTLTQAERGPRAREIGNAQMVDFLFASLGYAGEPAESP